MIWWVEFPALGQRWELIKRVAIGKIGNVKNGEDSQSQVIVFCQVIFFCELHNHKWFDELHNHLWFTLKTFHMITTHKLPYVLVLTSDLMSYTITGDCLLSGNFFFVCYTITSDLISYTITSDSLLKHSIWSQLMNFHMITCNLVVSLNQSSYFLYESIF